MRTIPSGLAAELADNGGVSLCRIVTITRKNGTVVRLAEAQADLVVGGNTYTAMRGIRMSSIPFVLNSRAQTVYFEVTAEDGGSLDPDDLRNGLYDTGTILISACSLANPGNGKVDLFRGVVGEIAIADRGLVKMEAVGLLSKAKEIPTTPYMPTCRHFFGDAGCKKDLGPLTVSTTITAVSGFNVTVGTSPGSTFKLGLITPTSGAGVGEGYEIRSVAGSVLKMYLPVDGKLNPGDAVNLTPGCDFTYAGTQGCTFWANKVNFGGFKDIPGADALAISFSDWGT